MPRARRRSELGLLLVGAITVVSALLLLSLSRTSRLPADLAPFAGTALAIIVVLQLVHRRIAPHADPVLLPVALVLNGIGYVMIDRVDPAAAGQQLAWTLVGLGVYVAVLAALRRSRDLERYRYLLAVLALVLLVSPLAPLVGENINGARLWVHLGSMEFQPVEVAKLLLVVFFASYFVEKRELLTIPTRRIGDRLAPDLRAFGPVAVAGVVSLLVILAEHDIGFSLILFVVFLAMIWVATGRWTYLAIGLAAFAVGTFLASHLLGQVNERIELWLDPWRYMTGPQLGYQPVQGEIAFGRGGLFGTGLGLGLGAGVIPYATSDFVFAVIGEELGLVGTAAVLVAYLLLVGSGLRAALRARSEFARLVAVGLTATLGFQSFFIMAGVVRLLPLTGVTLPFVSYGGSSLVANYALLALVMRISDEGNQPAVPPRPAASSTEGAAVMGAGTR
jgi:cell division protein FtsW (lipid II flippase)